MTEKIQPWTVGQKLVVRTLLGEQNAYMVTADGVTLIKPVSLPDGTPVVVKQLRLAGYTDVIAAGQRYRMLANSYLSMP